MLNLVKERLYGNGRWLGAFWLFNLLWLALLGCGYWPWLTMADQAWLTQGYVVATQLGWLGLFAVLALLACLLLAWLPIRPLRLVATGLGLAASTLLLADIITYSQYRFHLNGFVFDLFFAGGVIDLPPATWLAMGAIVAALVLVQLLFAWLARLACRRDWSLARWGYPLWLLCLLTSQGLHAWQDAHYRHDIPALSRHFPLYYPLTAKSALARLRLVDARDAREQAPAIETPRDSAHLTYPLKPIRFATPAKPRNVLFILVDSWRHDDANAQVMPNVAAYARGAMTFERHLSGGNSTQAGMFSLFYGLPPTYWQAFRNSGVRPVMMETFARQGYGFKILASAPLSHPPFDRTLFAGIEKLRLSTPGELAFDRDQRITDDMVAFLRSRRGKQPFMGMLFYDGAHSKRLPAGTPKVFTPAWDGPGYLSLNNDTDPLPYRNLYRNSLYYVDKKIGQVLETLRATGLDKDTLVVISADHGEEFNDNGKNYWGHGSNYSRVQLQVPLIIGGPGVESGQVSWPTTHYDLVPSVMKYVLGVSNPISDYALGHNLLDAGASRDWLLVGSYYNYAMVSDQEINVVSPGGAVETLTPQLNAKGQRQLDGSQLRRLSEQMQRFLD